MNHQIVSPAVVIATGVSAEGNREVAGVMVGDSESEASWTAFLRSLRERDLSGVRLVVSDSHSGLVKPSARSCSAPAGSGAGCISCAIASR